VRVVIPDSGYLFLTHDFTVSLDGAEKRCGLSMTTQSAQFLKLRVKYEIIDEFYRTQLAFILNYEQHWFSASSFTAYLDGVLS
jgi:hypothetical protein